jgi:hypothetical protein
VIVTAEGFQIGASSRATLGIGISVIEVGLGGRHSAADASGVAGFDVSPLFAAWSTAGGSVPKNDPGVRIGNCHPPLPSGLTLDCLASDIGNDRTPPGDLRR